MIDDDSEASPEETCWMGWPMVEEEVVVGEWNSRITRDLLS